MKKLFLIVLLYLFVGTAHRAIAEQGGSKSTDREVQDARVIQTAQKPLMRLIGLDRLYFQHVAAPAEALNAPTAVASLLPKLLRITDLNRETVNATALPEGLNVHDFYLPVDSRERKLWVRQVVYADHPRITKLWWGLYDRGQRGDVWYFIPDPSQTENKILSNYEIVDASRAGNGTVALRIQGSMLRPQGAWWIVGKVLTFSASDAGLAFSYVRNAFGFFKGYDLGKSPATIDISTEQELHGRLQGRTFIAVSKRVLRECKFREPRTDENWNLSWEELERAALCVAKKPGAKTTFRAFDESSFVERGGRSGE